MFSSMWVIVLGFNGLLFFSFFRSVPKAQESYALGHQMTLMRVLGAIPGPIVYGALIDQTCILWSSK